MVASRENPFQTDSDSAQNFIQKTDLKISPKASGDSGQNALLDTTRNKQRLQADQTLIRWALQAEARAILPNERVAKCLRVPHSASIDVLYDPEHQKGHYGGLCTCGSVWHDPVCAAKISERRRVECTCGIERINDLGFLVYMVTYTIKHGRYDDLAALLGAFLNAHDGLRGNWAGKKVRKEFSVIGHIRALETTFGWGTGWHPHVHELLFVGVSEVNEDALEAGLWKAWQTETERVGLTVNQKAFDFNRTRGAVQDYISKWGREPIRTPWGVEHEVSKAHVKQSRVSGRFSPFGLLLGIYQGHSELIPRFREYATYFKGKRQVQWSNGLKRMLLNEQEKTDQEIAAERQEQAILLGRLTREQWKVVLANDVRGELLREADSGDWSRVVAFLIEIGTPVDLRSWRE